MNTVNQSLQVAFFRLKKLKGKNIILNAAKHNKRTIAAELVKSEKINSNLSNLNESLLDDKSPEAIANKALSLMDEVQTKLLRKDAVRGIECIFSIPKFHSINERQFFLNCADWAQSEIGGVLLSIDIHRDESCPHAHILLLPLKDGKMNGSRLVGGRNRLIALQDSFHKNVANQFGFSSPPKRLYGLAKNQAAQKLINHLIEASDPACKSMIWQSIKDAIFTSPIGFTLDAGLQIENVKSKPQRTVAQIFTSVGKGKKIELSEHSGLDNEIHRTICSVGFTNSWPSMCKRAPFNQDECNDKVEDRTVDRETLKPSEFFNSITGEFENISSRQIGLSKARTDQMVVNCLETIHSQRLQNSKEELNDL